MFYEIHQRDIIRLMGGNLGMLPRFRVFEARETEKEEEKDESEPTVKRCRYERVKEKGLKNGRNFVVDGKLEQKSAGF